MNLNPDEPVKLTSEDTRDLKIKYRGQTYLLPAGESGHWPWKVAAHMLGDPTKRNSPRFPTADHEWERFRRRWGVSETVVTSAEEWERRRPKVKVETMDGQQIKMLTDGRDEAPDFTTGYSENDLKMKVAEMERQIRNLTQIQSDDGKPIVVTEGTAGDEQLSSEDDLPTDGGTAKSARTRKAPAPRASSKS